MLKIEILDNQTIDQIAAGEVVERPYSVVKELIENAIDSGADRITVEIKEGGTSLIRITDNGCGIEEDMVKRAFFRHATSKLRAIGDLDTIGTLGFRGEALSSIASVSRAELLTKPKDALMGVRYVIEGGEEKSFDKIGLPNGTTIVIKDLFYNTPARSKFLKSPKTEGSYISSLLDEMALSHPEISFRLLVNGKLQMQTAGNGVLGEVIYQIYGREVANNLIAIDESEFDFHLYGFLGKPQLSRGNRKYESFFVNGRYVQDRVLQRSLEDGYRNYLMQHQFPFAVLFLELPGNRVDVNVHPAKAQVRFTEEKQIHDFVSTAVKRALLAPTMIPQVTLEPKKEKTVQQPQQQNNHVGQKPVLKTSEPVIKAAPMKIEPPQRPSKKAVAESSEPYEAQKPEATPIKPVEKAVQEVQPDPQPERLRDFVQQSLPIEETKRARFSLVGQIFDTYWALEFDQKLYFVDQHAAHERVNFERFLDKYRKKTFVSQNLHPPIIVTLSPQEADLIETYHSYFSEFGFEIESFGGRDYSILAVPTDLYGMQEKEFFKSLLDELQGNASTETDAIMHRIATAACKASVKGRDRLSQAEAQRLLEDLFACDDPYHCPHGRPTMVSVTEKEIERMFKRIVS